MNSRGKRRGVGWTLNQEGIDDESEFMTWKLLRCPINGPRPVSEFQYAGEIRTMPDPDCLLGFR